MSGGAVVAAAAAAHRRGLSHVLDAFRLAGATAPDRARCVDDILAGFETHVDELMRAGVLVRGPRSDAWYLDEGAYVTWRDGRPGQRRRVALAVGFALLVAGVLVGLAVALVARRAP